MRPLLMLTVLLLVADVRRSFVDPAPVDNHRGDNEEHGSGASPPDDFDEVKQLEDLKHSFGKTFSVLKTHASAYSNVNGQREGHSETREEVDNDGKLVARVSQKVSSAARSDEDTTPATKVRTEVEIPSRGIHTALVQDSQHPQEFTDNGDRRSAQGISQNINNNNLDKFTSYAGVQYSPLDMAEYVFWTGDEKGVTVAIEEFLQEGLMTREEAIAFLQDIKMNLDYLQTHYMQQQRLRNQEQEQAKERAKAFQKSLGLQNEGKTSQHSSIPYSRDLMQALAKKNIEDMAAASSSSASKANERVQHELLGLTEDEYEELLERLRVADFLYTEYSLEEVIYQLAKVMFAQSLNRGSAEAQEALQKFTGFLEAEAEQGHISRNLEKKVLDVLIASLTDTLAEHPHLINVARDGLENLEQPSAGNHLLHQLLALNPAAAAGDSIPSGSVTEGKSEEHQTKKARENEATAKNSELHGVKASKAT